MARRAEFWKMRVQRHVHTLEVQLLECVCLCVCMCRPEEDITTFMIRLVTIDIQQTFGLLSPHSVNINGLDIMDVTAT